MVPCSVCRMSVVFAEVMKEVLMSEFVPPCKVSKICRVFVSICPSVFSMWAISILPMMPVIAEMMPETTETKLPILDIAWDAI